MSRSRICVAALALSLVSSFVAACSDDSSGTGAATSTGGSASDGGSGGEGTGATSSTGEGASSGEGGSSSGSGGSGGNGGTPAVTASPGCMTGNGLPEGENTFDLADASRHYMLHLPNGYTKDKQWPLLLALHPNGSNIDYWNGTSGPRNIRAQVENDAILVVAESLTGDWRDDEPTDLAYIDQVIGDVEKELCVDLGEIFSMGFSGGGSFSGLLGCVRDDIRAFASGGAVKYFEDTDCTLHTPAAWVTIGSGELVPERVAFREYWRERDGCMESSQATDPDPCVAYDGCDAATPMNYCQHGGGHEWPAFGTEAAWQFLKQFVTE
ncbi:MAG: hypothetical protein WKG00_22810 [Polyangiaceae bacterium]